MKRAIRATARLVNRFAVWAACDTFGDIASLSPKGPCERCVGRAVEDTPVVVVKVGGEPHWGTITDSGPATTSV